MSKVQKVINNFGKHTKRIILNRSLQPILPTPYLKNCDKKLFHTLYIKEEELFPELTNTQRCSCICVKCGWPQDKKL